MQDKKQKKTMLQLMFMILIFMVVLLTDFYAIINYPEEYILIAVITVILLIDLWGVVNGLFTLRTLKEERREEQYDSIFKSEKASYLMLKKYFEEIEEKIAILQEASKVPTEAIIGAQKGIAKVVINRNKENADAIMGSNEQLLDAVERFDARLKESDEFIIENQKNVLYENLKEIMDRQQTLSDSIKDMETRLSQVIAANPVQFTANVEMPKTITAMPSVSEAASQPVTAQNSPIKHEVVDDFIVPAVDEPVDMAAAVEPAAEPIIESTAEPGAKQVIEPTIAPVAEQVNTAAQEMPVEPVVEQVIEPIAEPIVEPAPVAEEAAADTANSDPNRQLSADEIAALFAGANAGAGEQESASEPEPASEPEQVEPPASAPEPENAPVVDLNNTNRNLTPDEIAALFKGQ